LLGVIINRKSKTRPPDFAEVWFQTEFADYKEVRTFQFRTANVGCILFFLRNQKYCSTQVQANVDFTNETASNPPARKKRLFRGSMQFQRGSTLTSCDLYLQKRSSCPPTKKKQCDLKKRIGPSRTIRRPYTVWVNRRRSATFPIEKK
jgi:hypothetical protein